MSEIRFIRYVRPADFAAAAKDQVWPTMYEHHGREKGHNTIAVEISIRPRADR